MATGVLSDMEAFADLMRMLGPPTPVQPTAASTHGLALFKSVGCALCHTPVLMTGTAIANGNESAPSAALSNQPVRLFSDLIVHHMGTGLADGITQGTSSGMNCARTAPLREGRTVKTHSAGPGQILVLVDRMEHGPNVVSAPPSV